MCILPKELNDGKLSILCESFDIEEEPKREGEPQKVYLIGKALTFDTPTRNKVAYTRSSGQATLHTWNGRPFLNSHKDDDVLGSIGHVESMEIKSDDKGRPSLWYKADIDPEEKDFIRKVKRKDIPFVSVQVLVSEIKRKENAEFGDYIEADIKEGLELSSVLIPGERETFGYITEENFVKMAESFLHKEQFPDVVQDQKRNEKPLVKKGDIETPNAAIVPMKPKATEDVTTADGGGVIQPVLLPKKIKKEPEPENKITPDLIPKRMISMQSLGSQGLDNLIQKKTNVSDETQEEQEDEYKYDDEKKVKYYAKGGNNIPAVPLKGYKAERLSNSISCCNKPMIVMENKSKGLALLCNKCERTIIKNEKFWNALDVYLREKLKLNKR